MNTPQTSVVLPVYNRAPVVGRAIASVLNQTFSDLELIVVDDGSTDFVANVVNSFQDPRVRLLRHETNRRAAAARNSGIAVARGSWLTFIDSDDEWIAEKLARQMESVDTEQDPAELSCTDFWLHRGEKRQIRRSADARVGLVELAAGCRLSPGSTMMVSRRLVDLVGPFDEQLPRLEDWDWLLRAAQFAEIRVLPEPLAHIYGDGWPSVARVAESVAYLREKHFDSMRRHGERTARTFTSALSIELAAAHFHQKAIHLAIGHLCRAALADPRIFMSHRARWRTEKRLTELP